MGFIAYDNRLLGAGAWTDTGADFAASPPITNMSTPQTPAPFAQFSGDTADFEFEAQDAAGAAENFTVRVLALIGHNLADGTSITWKDEAGATIGSQTVARFKNRPNNSIILLDADDTVNTVQCQISGAGSGDHRIAAAFAGPAWVKTPAGGFQYSNTDDGGIVRVDGTAWTTRRTRVRGIPFTAVGNRGEILGVNFDGTEYSGTDAETMLQTIGKGGAVIVAPSSGTQKEIDGLSVYGVLNSAGSAEQVSGDVFRVSFDVLEMR